MKLNIIIINNLLYNITAIGLFYTPTESATMLRLQQNDVYRTAATNLYCLYTYCYTLPIIVNSLYNTIHYIITFK